MAEQLTAVCVDSFAPDRGMPLAPGALLWRVTDAGEAVYAVYLAPVVADSDDGRVFGEIQVIDPDGVQTHRALYYGVRVVAR